MTATCSTCTQTFDPDYMWEWDPGIFTCILCERAACKAERDAEFEANTAKFAAFYKASEVTVKAELADTQELERLWKLDDAS